MTFHWPAFRCLCLSEILTQFMASLDLVLLFAACKMLSTSDWIYLDLEKSGCTFMRAILQELYASDCFVEARKHSLMLNEVVLPKIMTIRCPHEYYFSLWRYGLDGRGGFFQRISRLFPGLSRKMYEDGTPESFGRFLDFVLNSSFRYPNVSRSDWLPLGFDLYTVRIISMIVPVKRRGDFLQGLGSDFPCPERIVAAVNSFCPEILLRTKSLNSDFHQLAENGMLAFMNLPAGWQASFPLVSPRLNQSLSLRADSLDSFLLPGWRAAIESKSSVAIWMLEKAAAQF